MLLGFFRRSQIIYKRPQIQHYPRSILLFTTSPPKNIQKNKFHQNFTRQYSYQPHKDPHHHHPHHETEPQEPHEASPEYLQKYFGHLLSPENKPDDFLPLSLFNSPTTLGCLAEINSTEFKFPKLDAKILKEKYKEQLGIFENVHKSNLKKEGISDRITHYLHKLYKLRAAVPISELKTAISELSFLKKYPTYRVTSNFITDYPQWKQSKPQFFLNSLYLNPNFDPSRSLVGHTSTNEEEAAANVRQFRGVRGLILALEKGLTPQQKEHLHTLLESSSVTSLELQTVAKVLMEIGDEHQTESDRTRLNVEATSLLPPGTPGYKKLQEMLPKKENSTDLIVQPSRNPTEFKERFINNLLSNENKTPERQQKLEKLTQAIDHISQPEVQDDLQILHLLTNRELTPQQQVQLLQIFIVDDAPVPDSVLLDALNPHPLAAKIIGKRAQILMEEDVHYTRKFKEGAESTFQDVAEDPRYQKFLDSNPDGVASPTPVHYPFNNALEEIYHSKLEILAQVLGFDLHNELGLAKFDIFCQTYDISPGEATLDRCHQYPPPSHTYDELPLLKFDGYNPYDAPKENVV